VYPSSTLESPPGVGMVGIGGRQVKEPIRIETVVRTVETTTVVVSGKWIFRVSENEKVAVKQ
jgi:hypothetical protein